MSRATFSESCESRRKSLMANKKRQKPQGSPSAWRVNPFNANSDLVLQAPPVGLEANYTGLNTSWGCIGFAL